MKAGGLISSLILFSGIFLSPSFRFQFKVSNAPKTLPVLQPLYHLLPGDSYGRSSPFSRTIFLVLLCILSNFSTGISCVYYDIVISAIILNKDRAF